MCVPAGTGHADPLAVNSVEPSTAGRHEWERFGRAWHVAFAVLAIITTGLVAIDDGITDPARYLAIALIGALGTAYALLGARGLHRDGWTGPAYLCLAVPLTLALFTVAPVGALMLFALYPHIWAMLPVRPAILATIGVIGGCTAIAIVRAGPDDPELPAVLLVAGISLATALLLGLWIASIIRQSRRRADLVAQLATARAELATVSREAGMLAERERLAHEIHDTLAQGFTSVLLLLEAAGTALRTDPVAAQGHLDRARDTARANLAEARALVAALTPPDLSQTSLPEALRRLVDRAATEPGPALALTVTGAPRGLPAEQEVALLRTTQEALTNACRHAAASRIDVALAYHPDSVCLRIRDDGRGFQPDAIPPNGFGLSGMRTRAQRVGGAVSIETAPGAGATVRFDLPAGG
jgi:signal transduction histidine kinase